MVLHEMGASVSTQVLASQVSEWNEAVTVLARLVWLKHYQTLSESDIREAKTLGQRLLNPEWTPYGPGTVIFIEDEDDADKSELNSCEGDTVQQQISPDADGLDDVTQAGIQDGTF